MDKLTTDHFKRTSSNDSSISSADLFTISPYFIDSFYNQSIPSPNKRRHSSTDLTSSLEKNRIAAIKSREKKKSWRAELDNNITIAVETNRMLKLHVHELNVKLAELQRQASYHSSCSCPFD